ncbi:protein-disulfide reductase DsbD domain-containing protein [Oceanisphaera sp. W20_SRM_FM3]|uniref:protein-disulfide reductase DsbD domain-containing protein n=1 Tax=Oceanisphaera sp. W20_SRM_FM3 TaxID=3240267 RepID=UPI003F9D943C
MSAFIPNKKNYNLMFLLNLLTLACLPNLAHAGLFNWFNASDNVTSNQNEFLTPEQAFVLSSSQTADSLTLSFDIAPGYYLYRHQLTVTPERARLGDWQLPQGQPHNDAYFGESQVYTQSFTLNLPLLDVQDQAQVKVQYQGCTTDLCYAPQTVQIPIKGEG